MMQVKFEVVVDVDEVDWLETYDRMAKDDAPEHLWLLLMEGLREKFELIANGATLASVRLTK